MCVVGRRDGFDPHPECTRTPGRACEGKMRSHMNFVGADFLVTQGQAEWIYTERMTGKGKLLPPRREDAIRLVPRRTWKGKGKMSVDGARSMRVMQLVP